MPEDKEPTVNQGTKLGQEPYPPQPDASPAPNQAIPGDSPPQNDPLATTTDLPKQREVPLPEPENIPETPAPTNRPLLGSNVPPQPYPTAASDPGIQAQHRPANPPAPTSGASHPAPPKDEVKRK